MSSSKIFAGSRLRRLRLKLGLSQAAFAKSLGLSPSYLNLMERDQRPLTAQVVLKLSAMDGVDVAELAAGEAAHGLLQPLREMVADPLLIGEMPPGNELHEALNVAPNFANAALKLYGAYRETLKRQAEIARGVPQLAKDSSVEEWIAQRSNEDIEGLSEDIWSELTPKDDVFSGLKARLRASLGIDTRILPTTILGEDRSRYDRHTQRLMISEALPFESRIFEAAHLLARLEGEGVIRTAVATSPFKDRPEHLRQTAALLVNQLGLAMLAPRGKFSSSAEDLHFDLAALARRFSITQSAVMQRLATLYDDMAYLAVENTGQMSSRLGKLRLFVAKDLPLCAQLPLFDDGSGLHLAEMKPMEGESRHVIAHQENCRRHALFLTAEAFAKTTYATKATRRPWGPACRLCEVKNCHKRSAAAAVRPTGLNYYIRGTTDFEPM